MNIPNTFVKGVSLSWTTTLNDYPASTWDLSVVFVSPSDKQTINATASGDDHVIAVTPAGSGAFTAGRYDWQAYVTDGTDRYVVDSGMVTVIEDFATTTGFDNRSQLQQIVDAIDAYLLGNATNEQQKMRFGDREVWKYDKTELMTLRSQLKRELAIEEQNEAAAKGHSNGRIIRTVFR